MSWHGETLVGFDLETTGTEPLEARIVTAAVVEVGDGTAVRRREWLADPGVRIPEQASAIHGISSERAAADGRPAREVADEVADALTGHWARGVPVVAYNAAFDLTLLSAELRRYGLPSLSDRLGGAPIGPVVDPYTIDRAVDRYRRGKRNLEAVCAEYGVLLADAHDAAADALAAVMVARAIAGRHASVAELTPRELHARQVEWYARWAADFQSFLRRKGTPDAVIDPAWPLRSLEPARETGPAPVTAG
ncbi:3'-5' exonuclease [Streptomyces sp. NPDC047928]|uniref:3'-5' exonuclease n=1 Tax=unclassified Streptomyces TaxID=2593676 RepID=UPI00371501ED